MPYTKVIWFNTTRSLLMLVQVGESRGIPTTIFYEKHGNGPNKVLFVMGFLISHRGWRTQVNAFRKVQPTEYFPENETDDMFNDDYEVVVFDNRGVAKSEPWSGRCTTKLLAEDAIELVQHLGWSQFHLVGISMGGMISQEIAYALTNPNRPASYPKMLSLALSCTHAGGRYAFAPLAGVKGILTSLTIKDPEERAKVGLPILFSDKHLAVPEYHERYWKSSVERSRLDGPPRRAIVHHFPFYFKELPITMNRLATFLGQFSAVSTHYVTEARLNVIRDSGAPILIMTGDEDKLVRWENSGILNDILVPAEYIVFHGSGHGINQENKEEFNKALFRNFERAMLREKKAGEQYMLLLPSQILLVLLFTFLILAQLVVLLLDDDCDKPLRLFVIVILVAELFVFGVGGGFLLCNHFYSHAEDGTRVKTAYNGFKMVTNCCTFFLFIFFLIWICIGASWVARVDVCEKHLYNLSLATVIIYFSIMGVTFFGTCIYGMKKKQVRYV
ncbi:hypothetical protein PROFUN_07668 [Planoprotostelium fungivorum]|uniref:AB hydrolase-1 domain-containing protein n=1 Tax=Planoprotostelium fungivorum TaxID=1890364 RepID=A0A2P6MM41_9EUKA|nr:hypothetical protein PROFUN_07668 [Planoprotostelium fungivorum]